MPATIKNVLAVLSLLLLLWHGRQALARNGALLALRADVHQSSVGAADPFVNAHRAISANDAAAAAAYWQTTGGSAAELLTIGRNAYSGRRDAQRALRWYGAAVALDPQLSDAWFSIGDVCRSVEQQHPLCAEAAAHRDGNLLLNADFEPALDGWNLRALAADDVTIERCGAERCLHLRIANQSRPFAATVEQCLVVKAGRRYRFTARLRVASDDSWRPLYIQGVVEGENVGAWPQTVSGGQAWRQWAHEFVAPAYESTLCLHPLRLAGSGDGWISAPRLEELAP